MNHSNRPFSLDEQKELLVKILERCSTSKPIVDALASLVTTHVPDAKTLAEDVSIKDRSFKQIKQELDSLAGQRPGMLYSPRIIQEPTSIPEAQRPYPQISAASSTFRSIAPRPTVDHSIGSLTETSHDGAAAPDPPVNTKPKRGRPSKKDAAAKRASAGSAGAVQGNTKRARQGSVTGNRRTSVISSPSRMSTNTSPGVVHSGGTEQIQFNSYETRSTANYGLGISTPTSAQSHPANPRDPYANSPSNYPGNGAPRFQESRPSNALNYQPAHVSPLPLGPPLSRPHTAPPTRPPELMTADAMHRSQPPPLTLPIPPPPSRYANPQARQTSHSINETMEQ